MSAILNTFTGKNIVPKNEAVVYDVAIGQSGVINGCTLASLGSNQVSIAAGDGIIKGRKFTIEAETIACALATSGTMPGRIYLRMNLGNATTPLEIKTVAAASLPALTKDEECNFNNGIYEIELATYTASTTAVSNLVTTFNEINLQTILKTAAEVTANTEAGRLADALVIKGLITDLTANSKSFIFAYDSASASYGYKAGGADTFHPFNKIALAFKNFTVTNWNNGNGVLATVIPTVGIKKALVTLSGWGTGGCGGTLLITGSGVKSYTMLNAPSNGGTGIWSVELDGSVNAITINGVYYNQVNAYDGKLLDIC